MRMPPLQLAVYVCAAIFTVVTSVNFAAFTADDAYIVARYAVNARDTGAWVFNPGEHISAMTSPLHGLMLVALSLVRSDPLPLYKAIAAISVAISFGLLLVSYGLERREAMPLAAVLVAPGLILWTFAGLETPLLATIITAMATVYSRRKPGEGKSLVAIAGMTGAAVLTRYDAVLFAGPVFLAALVEPGWSGRQRLVAAIVAAVPPALWVAYAWLQFDAVLPTSFYIKTPTAALDVVTVNIRYMTEHMVIAGIGVMAVYTVASAAAGGRLGETVMDEFRARWGLHAGLLAILIYGASMATVHMMFAFRHFTPVSCRDRTGVGAHGSAGRQSEVVAVTVAQYLRGGPGRISHPRWFMLLKGMRCIADRYRVSAPLGNMAKRARPDMRATSFRLWKGTRQT